MEKTIRAKIVGDGTYEGTKVIDLADGKELPIEGFSLSVNEGYTSLHATIRPDLVDIECDLVLYGDEKDPHMRASFNILGMTQEFQRGETKHVNVKVDPLIAWFAMRMQKELKEARETNKHFPRYHFHQGLLEITKEVAECSNEDDEYYDLAMARIALQCAFQADAVAKWHSDKLAKKSDRPEEE